MEWMWELIPFAMMVLVIAVIWRLFELVAKRLTR